MRMQISDHFTFEQLADFVDDRVSTKQKQAVDLHLSTGCPQCNSQVAFLYRIKTAAETMNWQAPSRRLHRRIVNALPSRQKVFTKAFPGLFRWVVPAVLALILVTVVIFGQFHIGVVYAASISGVSGSVIMRLSPDAAWSEVSNGQTIPINAEIRTGLDGMATLIFPSGDKIEVSPISNFQLMSLEKRNGIWNSEIRQSTGTLTVHEKGNKNSTRFLTSGGEIISRGAYFQVAIHEDGSAIVNVEDGDVNVKGLQDFINIPGGQCEELPNIFVTQAPDNKKSPQDKSETKCPPIKNLDQPGSRQNQPFPDNQNNQDSQP